MTYLSKQDKNVTYISSQYLYLTLGMINREYIEMQRPDQKSKLVELVKDELNRKESEEKLINYYINDFYNRCRTKFSSIIDTSLKSLQRRRLIEFCHVYQMYYEIETDEGQKRYRTYSDDEETRDIMKIEREILDTFGYRDESEVWLKKRNKEYFEKVLKNTQELYPGLIGIYRCIKFIYNKEDIKNALNKEETQTKKKELNEKVYNFINNQAKKNYLKDSMESFAYTKEYEQAQYYLSDKLIKIE